jgi:hypothetical protein
MRFIRSSRPELPSPCHCFVSSFVPGAATDVEPGQLAGLIIDTLIMGSWRSDPETDGEGEPERCSRPRTRFGGRCRTMIGPRALPMKSPPAGGSTAAHSTGPVAMNTAAATSEVTLRSTFLIALAGAIRESTRTVRVSTSSRRELRAAPGPICHARDQIGDVGRQRRNPDSEEGRVRHQRRDATSTSDDSRHDSGRKQRTCGFGGQRHMRSLA